nr:unnamed protein product [Callosobruchus chinensis]
MATSSSTIAPVHWSSCSLNYLLLAFTHGIDYYLKNKPTSLFDGPVCGNGIVETGDECDCGLPESCQNTCCNATLCKLHDNATCATGECCDFTVSSVVATECFSSVCDRKTKHFMYIQVILEKKIFLRNIDKVVTRFNFLTNMYFIKVNVQNVILVGVFLPYK